MTTTTTSPQVGGHTSPTPAGAASANAGSQGGSQNQNQNQNQTTVVNIRNFSNVSTRVDRLLRERQMRRSQSLGTLYTAAKQGNVSGGAGGGGGGGGGGAGGAATLRPAGSVGGNTSLRRDSLEKQNEGVGVGGPGGGLQANQGLDGLTPQGLRSKEQKGTLSGAASSSPLGTVGQGQSPLGGRKLRRQSDSESLAMARGMHYQGGVGIQDPITMRKKTVSPVPVPFPFGEGHPGGMGGIGAGMAPELLGDWRSFSAEKLVLLGQGPETPAGQGMRISGSAMSLLSEPDTFPLPQGHVGDAPNLAPRTTTDQRLLIVANRLPLSAFKGIEGDWKLQASPGGLVSALTCLEGCNMTWIGWPGEFIDEMERESLSKAFKKEECCPVYLDPDTTDLFYNGYCNSVLWQLFHYIALQQEGTLTETQTVQDQYEAYKRANEEFLKAVMSQYQEGDIVWVHDYHLMLLPALLKEEVPNMKVGWFLHTPFPSSEIFRTLPQRNDILTGVLRADLVGFHTYDYARHFVSSCCRILGLEGTLDGIENAHMGTLTRVAVFPIGIDPEKWINELDTPGVQAKVLEMRRQFSGRKVLLGVDRLDMVKGIPQKLLAFEKFLEENPDWRNHVLLVQIAIPSRKDVLEYQKLTSVVHEMVGRINGRFGSLTQNPIHFLDCSLDFHNLCALYAVTDVLVVSSLRDGMNLVSYEFVACQSKDFPGVLVLSEFAGAAQSLGAGAILSNPYNVNELSSAIAYALKMGDSERQQRHRQNFMHVKVHTAQAWGETFISELHDTHVEAALRTMHIPPKLDIKAVGDAYRSSKSRLIVMGYNATLTTTAPAQPNQHRQFDQIRTLTQISPEVKSLLSSIVAQPETEVLVVSGSERHKLERLFEGVDVWLAAENGIFLKPPLKEWELVVENVNLEWMESVQLVFDYFCERTPRSYVDTRETSLVWNCKYADIDFGRNQMRDMLQHLWTGSISNAQVEILRGGRSVEARPLGVTKGGAVRRIMEKMHEATKMKPEMILVAGHFMHRDEDIFSFFDETGKQGTEEKEEVALVDIFGQTTKTIITCTVGRKHSTARAHLKSSSEVMELLHTFK